MRIRALRGVLFLSALGGATAGAQSTDTTTIRFTVGGVSVLFRPNIASEIVVAQLYLLGGSRLLTRATAGVEALWLHGAKYGSRRYPGPDSELALARTGSSIGASVTHDWSVYELRTVRSELDSAWMVFADRIVAPELTVEGIGLVRARLYVDIQRIVSDPDRLAQHFADSVAFTGHPYAIDPGGSEASIRDLRTTDVRDFQARHAVTSRMRLVVVGNATRAQIERLVSGTLATLPAGDYVWTLPPELPAREATMTIIPRRFATNYILGFFPGPRVGTREHPAFRLATALLGARLAREIREERQLSYAAYAPFLDRAVASGGVYVSTGQPAATMRLVARLMGRVIGEAEPWQAMPYFVTQFTIGHLFEMETYAGQASALAAAELLRGDYRQPDWWLRELKRVSPLGIQRVARRYFPKIQYVYVGDTAVFRDYIAR